jgi:hypothetical protein
MKLKELYQFAIEQGKIEDPRGAKVIDFELKKVEKEFSELKGRQKDNFDKEKLTNPYADTRIIRGDENLEINTILAGIDIDVGEVLLVDRLRTKGVNVDLAYSHHPMGRAYANFYEVMGMQADIVSLLGVPINVAENMLAPRIKEVGRRVHPVNHNRVVDAAKHLDITLICVHTPSDNFVTSYLQKLFDNKKPYCVNDIMDILSEIPEYNLATKDNAGPKIIVGSEKNRAGKVFVEMTGGTEGAKEIYERLSQAGVGTVIGMHLSEEHKKEIEKYHINVVIAGHISSDNLGINLLFDRLQKKYKKLNIIECSGFRRITRG